MTSTTAVFALDGEVTIPRAAALREALMSALDGGARCLDLGQVVELDSAGVQLLIAARKTAQAAGDTLSLAPVSETVRGVLATYGLLDLLGQAA